MKLAKYSKFMSNISVFLASVFAIVVVLGASVCAQTLIQMSHSDGHAGHHHQSPCNAAAGVMECGMNIFDHIAHWQNTFVFSFLSDASLLLLFVAVLVAVTFALRHSLFILSTSGLERYKLYHLHHPHRQLYSYFLTLFSQGILHSKIFA